MYDLFNDMAEGILDLIGEDAFYNGSSEPIRVNIEHGVQLSGMGSEEAMYRGDVLVQKDVMTIEMRHNPRAGATVRLARGGVYRLESVLEDNGFTKRFVILKMG